jgi:hypothetical protein
MEALTLSTTIRKLTSSPSCIPGSYNSDRFFVAIPPQMRPSWARQMNKLVKPGGYLVSLVYPMDPSARPGPPYYVKPEHLVEELGGGWEKLVDEVPRNSTETHRGRESLLVLRRL